MTALYTLSAFIRAQFILWTLLLCLACIIGMLYSIFLKKYSFTFLAFLVFAASYFLWQVLSDIQINYDSGGAAPVSILLGRLSFILWLFILIVLSIAAALVLILNFRYANSRITPTSIKHFADKMPCGICYWRESGRVIFSNICMNELCIALTGLPLLNGNIFRNSITDKILTINGRTWRFIFHEFYFDYEPMYEMIASDITEIYMKTKELEKETAELSVLNQELQEYYQNIDETIYKQEILQAKINIHDEMNRLMLHTAISDSDDNEALNNIFSLWEKNTLLLYGETNNSAENDNTEQLEQLAKVLDIRLIWQGSLPNVLTPNQRELFFTAAQEAIANAVKHSNAKIMEISFSETDTAIICSFENNGNIPKEEVVFTGGLANLAYLINEQDSHISVKVGETFKLSLHLAKNS